MELSLNCCCSRITLGVTGLKLLEVVGVKNIFFFFMFVLYVCALHLLISKYTAIARGYAKVQRPCISFILFYEIIFLLTEACFNVYRFVAVTYFSTTACVSLVVK